MNQEEVFLRVVRALNGLDLDYAVTGAYAVSAHGEPRATHDIDFQVHIAKKDIDSMVEAFQGDFYVSREGILHALRHKTMFNLIHQETQVKIDFWISKETAYDKIRMRRRLRIDFSGVPVSIISPEDAVLTKLDWYKKTEMEKHVSDAAGIVRVQGSSLDGEYIDSWADRLSVKAIWKKVRR